MAILCSHNFSHPFNQPIAYAQKVGELTNMLGAGHIMVQRFGDILDGLHCLGDSSGWTRGLMMASVMGVLMGRVLAEAKV